MADLIDPIIPRRWIPPFRRNDWTVEEVIKNRVQLYGHYDQKVIPNCEAVYTDPASEKRIIVTFQDGDIWRYEVPHPISKQLVVLGDDNRVYRNGEPMPDRVIALDNWLEPAPQD